MEATPAISIDDSLIFSVYFHCSVLYSVLIVQIISSWVGWKEELAMRCQCHIHNSLLSNVSTGICWQFLLICRTRKYFSKPTCLCFQGRSWSVESRLYNSLYLVTSRPSWALVSRFLFAKTKSKVQITQNGQYLATLLQIRSSLMLFVQIRCCTQGSNKIWHVHCSDQAWFNYRGKNEAAKNSVFCPKYIED